MAYGPGWTDEQYTAMFTKVALKRVTYSKTEEVVKALAVIMHRKSLGFLSEYDRYLAYFAKYVSTPTIEGEGIGHFWGTIGAVGHAEGEAEDHGRRSRQIEEIPSAIPTQQVEAQEEAQGWVRDHDPSEAEIREVLEKPQVRGVRRDQQGNNSAFLNSDSKSAVLVGENSI